MGNDPATLPAVIGGSPVRPSGPPAWPVADEEVLRALEGAYRDSSWGKYQAHHVARLEEELARFHGLDHVLCCSSGTLAVELALRALRVGAGDEVILAAYDYGGNFLSILAVGARPVLVDVDPDSWNMAPAAAEAAIGPRTRAIIASHLHGGVVPISRVVEAARRHGVPVIEDAAQMPGARIEGRVAGAWGDVGIISFGGSKLLTAGRGGALVTRHRDIHHRARLCGHRGNQVYPLSELQAAVLLPQLARLAERNRLRSESVRLLRDGLAGVPGLRPLACRIPDTAPGYFKVGFQLDPKCFGGLSRDRLVEAVRAEGIALDAGFRSLHVGRSLSRYRRVGQLAEAERAHHGMVVLHHPVLLGPPAEIEQVIQAVRKIYEHRERLVQTLR